MIAIAAGPPSLGSSRIGLPTVLVAVRIGVTTFECKVKLTTYAVFPSGVIAMAVGPVPTLIGLPAVLVDVRIGVTVLDTTLVT